MWCGKKRMRLVNEIHDTVLQELIHLRRETKAYQQNDSIKEIKHGLLDLEKDISSVVVLLREICFELYPTFLSEFGLRQSLQDLVRKMQLRTHIILRINFEELFISSNRLNINLELALYRITQVLLTNAIQHSKASLLSIKVQMPDQNIKLQYIEDGIGMDTEQLYQNDNQIGLIGMKERVRSVGGSIHLKSQPNKGMQVEIEIPAIIT